MLGVMVIVGSGVWEYERSLQSGVDSWLVDIPFTGTFMVRDRGDAEKAEEVKEKPLNINWGTRARILDPGDWPEFQANQEADQKDVHNAPASPHVDPNMRNPD